jgi:predicted nucleic acid-binding protein
MLVVADSSPLHYLVLIDHAAILPTLFGQVVIPPTAVEELQRSRTSALVRDWMSSSPACLEIRHPRQTPEALLFRLGAGERDVIVLAQEMQATLLWMNDMEGRAAAEHLDFSVMGTLRVLELAAERGLLDLSTAIAKLQATSFYAPAAIIREMLARNAARKGHT